MPTTHNGRLYSRAAFNKPEIYAGAKMPTNASIRMADRAREQEAEIGSRMLLEAIQRYVANGGRW